MVQFPDSLKVAIITPIYKGVNPTNFTNYRPISVLSAFQKKSNTIADTINLLSNIFSNKDKKKKCVCLLLDLKKAFDGISMEIRFEKKEGLQQAVKINIIVSEYVKLNGEYPRL
jgi:hypothetical protein